MRNEHTDKLVREKLTAPGSRPEGYSFDKQAAWKKLEGRLPQAKKKPVRLYAGTGLAAALLAIVLTVVFYRQPVPGKIIAGTVPVQVPVVAAKSHTLYDDAVIPAPKTVKHKKTTILKNHTVQAKAAHRKQRNTDRQDDVTEWLLTNACKTAAGTDNWPDNCPPGYCSTPQNETKQAADYIVF